MGGASAPVRGPQRAGAWGRVRSGGLGRLGRAWALIVRWLSAVPSAAAAGRCTSVGDDRVGADHADRWTGWRKSC